MTKYDRIIAAVRDQPWAILPSKLAAITSLLELRAAGITLTDADIAARIGGDPQERIDAAVTDDGIGVVQVFGVLSQRLNLMGAISGGTSTEELGAEFRALRDDPRVRGIVMAVDSPGGSLYGVDELATEIRESRGTKPIVAVASSMAASAAYWLAAQADEVYVTPGGDVGSVGVFTAHEDLSGLLEKKGVKVTLVSAGPHKTEGNPFAPLDDDARATLQARVDDGYARFVAALAAGRRVPESFVRSDFGGGRLVGARDAVAARMADGVATLDAAIARLNQTAPRPRAASAASPLRADVSDRRPSATPHEPSQATGHERHADARQRQEIALALIRP